MTVRCDTIGSARSNLLDTSGWGPFCDITLTLKQARQSDNDAWVKIDNYACREAFRHFMAVSTERHMELHFVVTANVFGSCPYWKKAKSAPAHYVRGSGPIRAMAYPLCA